MKGDYEGNDFINPFLMDKKKVSNLIYQLQSRKKTMYNSILKSMYPSNITKKIVLEDAWERFEQLEEAALKESEVADMEMGSTHIEEEN